jgi:thiol:disulfide interchange protein DsbA
MIRRIVACVALALLMVACSPAPSSSDTSAPAAATPAPAPETPAATPAPVVSDASTAPAAEAPVTTPAPAAPPMTAADAPRLGTDYELLPTPQPTFAPASGKIEIDEVFSYRCIHCAEFQPSVNAWEKTKPADVNWVYVPAAFGESWDDFARAYYAAEIMGVRERTHNMVFKGVFEDNLIKTGSQEEIADMYGKFGVDRNTFLATMQSFGVTAKLNRSRQFALRTGVQATPTIILNGKYRVSVTRDRGFDGLLKTVDFLIAQERNATATAATP